MCRYQAIFPFLFLALALSAQKPALVVPTGHSGGVSTYATAPNGQFFLSAGSDNTFKLWDTDGRQLRDYPAGGGYCRHLEFSPDGKRFVAALDSSAYAVDVASGAKTRLFEVSGNIQRLRHSPDGQVLGVLVGQNSAVRLWSLAQNGFSARLTGGSEIRDFAFSPDGKSLATLNRDRTITVWDLAAQKPRNSFPNRFADEVGNDTGAPITPFRNIHFSPDGKNLLASVSITHVQLYDAQTGKVLRTWEGFSGRISPDGRYYGITTMRNAVEIYAADSLGGRPYRGLGVSHGSYDGPPLIAAVNLMFCADSRHAIVDAYGSIERWEIPTNTFKNDMFRAVAAYVHSADFSPDGKSCAITTGKLLQQIHFPPGLPMQTMRGHTDFIGAVEYSRDGAFLATAARDFTAKTWDARSGKPLGTFDNSAPVWPVPSFVEALDLSPDDTKLYKFTPFLVRFDLRDSSKTTNLIEDSTFGATQLDVSDDGQLLAMNFSNVASFTGGVQLIQLQNEGPVAPRKLTWGAASAFKILPDSRTLAIADQDSVGLWDTETLRMKRAVPTAAVGLDFPTAMDASPDGKWLVTSDDNGKIALWALPELRFVRLFEGHGGNVSAARFSKDSRRLISAAADQTTRIWDVATGRELAQIILFGENDWAVVSPGGLFDASPGGMNYLYFVVENEALELYQLKKRYYEPGLLSKLLGFSDEPLRPVPAFADLPLYPKIKADIHLDTLRIALQKRNGGIGRLSLFINGQERANDLNPQRLEKFEIDLSRFSQFFRFDTLNTILLRAANAEGWLESQAYPLQYNPNAAKGNGTGSLDPARPAAGPPTLHALLIGTSNYVGEKLDLRFPDKDAAAMADAIQAAGAELYAKNLKVKLLRSNAAAPEGIASKANIELAMQELAKTKPNDVLLLYFSGHGVNYGSAENAQFYYLTKDIASEDLSDPEIRKNYAVSSDEISTWLSKIPAEKRVLIFDACNSGKVVEDFATLVKKDLSPAQIRAFDRMKDRTGMFILTGSAADKVSYEASQYGQGLLTYSLLLGMSGPPVIEETDPRVDVMRLFQFSRDRVPDLAKGVGGVQVPMLSFPASGASFDIGIVNNKVKIPVAQMKPVFIRNNFQDESTFDDGLGLSQALAEYFQGMTAKGAQAEVIYVDASNYENAWSLKGRYTLTGDAVQVTAKLFKGKAVQGEYKVQGKKSDLNGLVEAILEAIWPKVSGE